MQNIFKIDAIRALRSVRVTTERLARVMRRDALSRKRDFQQIKELNYRLARVIPIIPGQLGTAGVIFGVGEVASSSGGLFLPPFPPFGGGLPPVRQGPGPKRPKGPSGQPTGQQQPQVIKEELEEPQVVTEGEDIRSAEYNRRRQEEAKRKAEEERIKQGVPAKVPAQPGQTPAEREEEAKPERQEPTTPAEPPFVPRPIKIPDPEKLIEALGALTGVPAPPFFIPDVISQKGVPATAPPITIPNFDPNDQKQRDDLKQKIGTYIFKVPNSDFERKLERGGVLPDGTLVIKRKGQQVSFSEPLTEEQLALIRLMGFVNISEWLPVVPIRGAGPRRGTVPGTSRPNRPLIPRTPRTSRNQTLQQQKQQLEESFQRPSVPGSGQGTQPPLPGTSTNQPKIPAAAAAKKVGDPIEKAGPTIDVNPVQSTTSRSSGIVEQIFNPSGQSTRVKKFNDAYKEYSNRELYKMMQEAPLGSRTRIEYQKILDKRVQENVIQVDPSSMQGPAQAGSGVREIIQPIVIRTD